eukprot:Lithocolla_globosa_v1_NODE_928_length_3073_cov_1148.102386.p3 type:complete len:141 gc:universal NODE_928_length_3073_cov_1148.102386:1254-1676(+)
MNKVAQPIVTFVAWLNTNRSVEWTVKHTPANVGYCCWVALRMPKRMLVCSLKVNARVVTMLVLLSMHRCVVLTVKHMITSVSWVLPLVNLVLVSLSNPGLNAQLLVRNLALKITHLFVVVTGKLIPTCATWKRLTVLTQV